MSRWYLFLVNDQCFFIFSEKRHKIVDVCYFALFRLQFNVNYNRERFVNRF